MNHNDSTTFYIVETVFHVHNDIFRINNVEDITSVSDYVLRLKINSQLEPINPKNWPIAVPRI